MKRREKHSEYKLDTINSIETDYKSEVIAAGLIEIGYDPDKTLIVRQGGNRRHVAKDINRIENEFSSHDLTDYLYIYSNKHSIYDSLPEGIFHQPYNTAQKRTKEDIVKEIRRHRDEEFFARRYFKPFEIILDQALVDAQIYERKFDKKNINPNLSDIFSRYWPVLKLLSVKQAVLFTKLIPLLPNISNNFDVMGQLMGIILDVPVKIYHGKKTDTKIENLPDEVSLGNCRLKETTILGNRFEDGYRDINVKVGPLSSAQMKSFEKNTTNDLILKGLTDMMLPCDCRIKVRYESLQTQANFIMSEPSYTTYLGINTVI